MSQAPAPTFGCPSCNRSYAWKEQLAGKKAKCKCGSVIAVPRTATGAPPVVRAVAKPAIKPITGPVVPKPAAAIPAPPKPSVEEREAASDEELYDFADYVEPPPPPDAPMPVLALAGTSVAGAAVAKLNAQAKVKSVGNAVPLGYGRGGNPLPKDRFSAQNLMDMQRDVYAPTALLVVGVLIYIAYFCTAYHLRASAVGGAAIGVTAITALKTLLLVGFALLISGPLGVSFGGLWTAILKLAATAVFCDGVASWADYAVQKAMGPHSGIGGLVGSFLMAFVIYWSLFTYLFSMDTHDAFMCTRILFIFDRILRWVLFLLIIGLLSQGANVSRSRASTFVNPAAASDPLVAHVKDLKETGCLGEARAYIAKGNQGILAKPVDDWYAAGCPNVWIEELRADINGRWSPLGVIVELPSDPAGRAKCFDVLKAYYKEAQIDYDPLGMKDTGQIYLPVMLRA